MARKATDIDVVLCVSALTALPTPIHAHIIDLLFDIEGRRQRRAYRRAVCRHVEIDYVIRTCSHMDGATPEALERQRAELCASPTKYDNSVARRYQWIDEEGVHTNYKRDW